MKDDILFTGTGPLLEIWKVNGEGTLSKTNISWPGTNELIPQKISELNFGDYQIGGLEINGNYLYVGHEGG